MKNYIIKTIEDDAQIIHSEDQILLFIKEKKIFWMCNIS